MSVLVPATPLQIKQRSAFHSKQLQPSHSPGTHSRRNPLPNGLLSRGMTDELVLPLHSPPNLHSDTQKYPQMTSENASEPSTAHGIASLTVHIPSAFRESARRPTSTLRTSTSRWNTLEFRFYYLAALFAIPAMAWVPISLSQGGPVSSCSFW
jgi:hypothetical protein